MRDDRLLDILDSIGQIEQQAAKGKEAFLRDEMIQVWMRHHLLIIGEAAAGLSRELRGRNPEVSWADIIAMRNIIVHEYFGVDLGQVWDAVIQDLPRLKRDVEGILEGMEP
ncbi:MAG: DUF86 domain-containing protein [Candidatus Tectomicrobia bacterium]|uniref:DUF86 domain-containing protein n=1 Tax=Tectimicrobiota bacterium TaxID=2528274 RepID=A0A932I3F0_UNCTE|nr:DUF86 domain-containing protein [Candidatus Tectomicrobia bacterium]